ncbi:hypothetical protein AB4510_22255 [Vibrio sp. 10N.222.54.B12]|uniref:hypothetical protein n=1 Tax=unclassified Vibrio TaxID=2614977 RepID=UPI001056CBA6|nr:hypothetical protein [Vibrio sp. 10N.286.49.B3]
MRKVVRIAIKAILIWCCMMVGGMVNIFVKAGALGALPSTIMYAGVGAAIFAIYKYKGKSDKESTELALNKES